MGKLSFGTTGIAYECNKVTMDSSGAPQCPRCHGRVYYNEEKKAIGKSWHKRCFTCTTCRKSLDSTNCNEHDGDVYCASCHRRQFGPRGYGFAGGAAGLSTESTVKQLRPQPSSQVYAVPQHIPASTIDPDSIDCCPGCGKRVFFAEEIKALKRSWHKLCFKCNTCRKLLEPGSCSEHERSLFCRACYSKQFGPKGYGFAGGAASTMAAEDRYTVEARAVNSAQFSEGETYTINVMPQTDRVETGDRWEGHVQPVNSSQSNDSQVYTLETRRKPTASNRYTDETARGAHVMNGRPAEEIQPKQLRPMPDAARYRHIGDRNSSEAKGVNGMVEQRADERVYTIQSKKSASSRLFPDERRTPETMRLNGSPQRERVVSFPTQTRAQSSTGSGSPIRSPTNNPYMFTNGSKSPSGSPYKRSIDERHSTGAVFTRNFPEQPPSGSYPTQMRVQRDDNPGEAGNSRHTSDVRRVNGVSHGSTWESYVDSRTHPDPGFGLMPGARRSSETVRPMGEQPHSVQTRALPNNDYELRSNASHAADIRRYNGTNEKSNMQSRPHAGTPTYDSNTNQARVSNSPARTGGMYNPQPRLKRNSYSPGVGANDRYTQGARFMNHSSGADEMHNIHARTMPGGYFSGVVPDDRYTNGVRSINGSPDWPLDDMDDTRSRNMSAAGSVQHFASLNLSSPNSQYNGQTNAARPMTTADVEEMRYSIQARATPSVIHRSPVQNGQKKAAPVYV